MFAKLKTMAVEAGKSVKLPSSSTLAKLLPLLVLAIGLTALAMMFMWRSEAGYKPLFGANESVAAADTMAVLDGEKIPYRIHPQTGQVLVPEAKLGQVRMLLAAKGVVAKLPEGLELVDKSDPLGVSQFVQDVRFRRGLEGELVKSIASLDSVESARVHLSIAKSSSFILSDGEKSSASVMLTLKPGRKLGKEQISAIVGLVSGSVANLEPGRVTVIDQHGNYLSSSIDPSDPAATSEGELGARVREDTLHNIQELLAQSIGNGNFKASVAVDTDNDRVEETREQYGEAPHISNEATRGEQDNGEIALGVPGSLSNRPPQDKSSDPAGGKDKPGPHSQKNAISRQYVYDRNVVQIKHSPTRVKRVSVAVVLSNTAAPDGKAWTPAQLRNIETILRSGIGLDESRKDQLSVSAIDFHDPKPEALLPWWKQPENMLTMGGYAGYALLALLVFLLVLRPLLKILRQWVASQYPVAIAADTADGNFDAALPAEQRTASSPLDEDELQLPPVGSSADVLVEHLRLLAVQAPERVADVIKPWIRKHG
ncbi:flagellar basal-body MS-ring/collar protein FliF [Dyella acidiphila]|uniref:Flagellar M-ring protein n=1 Tax=Dyella acidiphila TaxID=2775866 RepID=A0ABR9G9A1_9GAMM|nr:flagellar basal-body MS-ring/collar protein FliF [Dyella acidiphila]MBE1160598.1 flagellar M-ring protein FliF [Dyella acidiphila]